MTLILFYFLCLLLVKLYKYPVTINKCAINRQVSRVMSGVNTRLRVRKKSAMEETSVSRYFSSQPQDRGEAAGAQREREGDAGVTGPPQATPHEAGDLGAAALRARQEGTERISINEVPTAENETFTGLHSAEPAEILQPASVAMIMQSIREWGERIENSVKNSLRDSREETHVAVGRINDSISEQGVTVKKLEEEGNKIKQVCELQETRVDRAELTIAELRGKVTAVKENMIEFIKELGGRVTAVEDKVAKTPIGISEERLQEEIGRVSAIANEASEKVALDVVTLANVVEKISDRVDARSDRTEPDHMGIREEIQSLRQFQENQKNVNERNKLLFDHLFKEKGSGNNAAEGNTDNERLFALRNSHQVTADAEQSDLEQRLSSLRNEVQLSTDTGIKEKPVTDVEDCRRHFVSVQSYLDFPGEDNEIHPKIWVAQFEHSLPDSWGAMLKIKFAISHLRGEEAVTMQMRSKECATYEDFKRIFLEEFWSKSTQERTKLNIILKESYNDYQHKSPLAYFRSLMKDNQYLDEPYPDPELIRICLTKLPRRLQKEIAIAGRYLDNGKHFQQLLQELGGDKPMFEPIPVSHNNPGRGDNRSNNWGNNPTYRGSNRQQNDWGNNPNNRNSRNRGYWPRDNVRNVQTNAQGFVNRASESRQPRNVFPGRENDEADVRVPVQSAQASSGVAVRNDRRQD